jgi:hypothetical protein
MDSKSRPDRVENEHFAAEALRLVEEAEQEGILLRILGSIAYRIHSPRHLHLFAEMARALTDVDFAADRSQARLIVPFLEERGYVQDKGITVASEGSRYCFWRESIGLNVDVFMDELYFCHRIPFRGRLELDSPTITTTDLLLEKMQIVEINLKDIKDTIVLLLEHPIAASGRDREKIDASHVAALLSQEWGFYHTVNTNLEKVLSYAEHFDPIDEGQRGLLRERVKELQTIVDAKPKPVSWKLRARVGTKVRWYQEVAGKDSVY